MASNYLQLVQTACRELGLVAPAVVAGSTDLQIIQLGALMNADLLEIVQNYNWTALQTEFDLYVSQPSFFSGTVTRGSPYITNVAMGVGGDFNPGFGDDFNVTTPLSALSPLWLVSGANIVVNTRIVTVDTVNNIITMSQPATGNASFITITAAQDTYPGPADFDRYINQTWWDRTNRWALIGPDSPQVDQWHRSGIVTIGPRRHFRQIGHNGFTGATGPVNNYRVWPAPAATDTPLDLVYEYISNQAVISNAGALQTQFLADTDFPILDGRMFVLGAKWRMWQIKGFDYAAMQQEYIDYVERKYANDGGAKTLSLVGSRVGLYQSLVQDGNFPSTATSGQ